MKILIFSDIHSNWPALEAVAHAEPDFDVCLCAGDVVDYATNPEPCIDWVRTRARFCVRGNHDHAVAQRIRSGGGPGMRDLARATRPWHWHVLDDDRLTWLAELPVTMHLELDGLRFFLVHGTPRDPLDEYLSNDETQWRNRLQDVEANVVCVGHTHQPFLLDIDGTRVINPGSVGQPRDGDPRASYVVMENGNIDFRRVEYDIDATVRNLEECGVSREMCQFAEDVLRQGGGGR